MFNSLARFAFTACLGLLVLAGCGGGGPNTAYPVSGRVTSHGQPVAQGTVTFVPQGDGTRVATGEIRPDGYYALTTTDPSDGAMPGKYRVTITSEEAIDPSKGKPAVSKKVALTPEETRSAPKRSVIASKYGLPDASGLTAQVEAGSNTKNFDLP
jgi:hypothetical protein